MGQWENRALLDLRAAGSNPVEQLTIDLFPRYFSSSYKNSMSTFKFRSQVPHQSFRGQITALFTLAFDSDVDSDANRHLT